MSTLSANLVTQLLERAGFRRGTCVRGKLTSGFFADNRAKRAVTVWYCAMATTRAEEDAEERTKTAAIRAVLERDFDVTGERELRITRRPKRARRAVQAWAVYRRPGGLGVQHGFYDDATGDYTAVGAESLCATRDDVYRLLPFGVNRVFPFRDDDITLLEVWL